MDAASKQHRVCNAQRRLFMHAHRGRHGGDRAHLANTEKNKRERTGARRSSDARLGRTVLTTNDDNRGLRLAVRPINNRAS